MAAETERGLDGGPVEFEGCAALEGGGVSLGEMGCVVVMGVVSSVLVIGEIGRVGDLVGSRNLLCLP